MNHRGSIYLSIWTNSPAYSGQVYLISLVTFMSLCNRRVAFEGTRALSQHKKTNDAKTNMKIETFSTRTSVWYRAIQWDLPFIFTWRTVHEFSCSPTKSALRSKFSAIHMQRTVFTFSHTSLKFVRPIWKTKREIVSARISTSAGIVC